MHIALAVPYEVVFHATDNSAISQVELTINDQKMPIPSGPAAGKNLVTVKFTWAPAFPGQYMLRARSQNAGGTWSDQDLLTIWVDAKTPTATLTPTGTLTITPTVTGTPGAVTVSFVKASVDKFYFGDASCGPVKVTLEAQVSDTQQIRHVLLFIKLQDIESGKYTNWNDGTDMLSQGNGKFSLVLESKSIPDIGARDNCLIYQFVGTGPTNQPVARTPVYSNITLSDCGRFILVPPPG